MMRTLATLRKYTRATSELAKGLTSAERWQGNIAMFHDARCGSSVLASLLGQHSAVHWDGEVFGEHNPAGLVARYLRENHPRLYLRQRIARSDRPIYGCETKLRKHLRAQLGITLENYLEYLPDLGFEYYIHLDRKNTLRRTVSNQVALKTKKWNISTEERPQLTQVSLDPEKLIPHLQAVNRRADTLERELSKQSAFLQLMYEEHIKPDPRIGYRRVCEFVGIPAEEVAPRLRKANPYKLSEMVENYDEVARLLSGTPYEWMLDG